MQRWLRDRKGKSGDPRFREKDFVVGEEGQFALLQRWLRDRKGKGDEPRFREKDFDVEEGGQFALHKNSSTSCTPINICIFAFVLIYT